MKFDYTLAKLFSKFSKNKYEYMSNFFRKKGMHIGKECNITCDIRTTESYLISIGNNVTISTDVLLLTHDASVGKIFGKENGSDLLGKIIIGDNCFIGARSTILLGVTITNNVIVASGSVVTKSVSEEGIIIAGNPAKKISDWNSLKKKSIPKIYKLHGLKRKYARHVVEKNPERLLEK